MFKHTNFKMSETVTKEKPRSRKRYMGKTEKLRRENKGIPRTTHYAGRVVLKQR